MAKSTHYRIYCEYFGMVSDQFISSWFNPNGITITHGDGYWMGKHENTLILDYIAPDYGQGVDPRNIVNRFAKSYCEKFGQDCVLVTSHDIEWELVSAGLPSKEG